jgi:MinD-like ATPase involved in chromosome partitioning or flagellar assembly
MCEIVAFTGGEGAPGRTFLSFNIATILGFMGFGVTFVELGNSNTGMCSYFGMEPVHSTYDFAAGLCSAEEVVIHCGNNLDLIVQSDAAPVIGERENKLLFSRLDELHKTDFIIIDAPEGVPDSLIPVLDVASNILAVVTPHQVVSSESFRFIRNLADMCRGKHIHVILNRAPVPEIAEIMCNRLEHDFSRMLGIPMDCAWFVPEDTCVHEAMNARLPFITLNPGSETSLKLMQLATAIEFATRERYQGRLRQVLQALLVDLQRESIGREKTYSAVGLEEYYCLQRTLMEALNADEVDSVDFRNFYEGIREIMEVSRNLGFDHIQCRDDFNAFPGTNFAP